MAELPAAEIADSGAPMHANVAEEPISAPTASVEREETSSPQGINAPVAAVPTIRQAIEEIQKINKDLEWVLLEMEKAVETLEEAEVQKYADEREIESLRNAMRQLNRTREAVQRVQQPGPRHEGGRPRHPQRDHRDPRRFEGRQRHEPRPPRPHSDVPPPAHESQEHHPEPPPHDPDKPEIPL